MKHKWKRIPTGNNREYYYCKECGTMKSYIWYISSDVKTDYRYNYPKGWKNEKKL